MAAPRDGRRGMAWHDRFDIAVMIFVAAAGSGQWLPKRSNREF